MIMFFDVTNTGPDRTKNPGSSNSLAIIFFLSEEQRTDTNVDFFFLFCC